MDAVAAEKIDEDMAATVAAAALWRLLPNASATFTEPEVFFATSDACTTSML